MSREVKSLKYQSLVGFSDYQIKEHHDVVYAGQVKELNEIENALLDAASHPEKDSAHSLRELKAEEIETKNAVKLHEIYFAGLGAGRPKAVGELAKMIEQDFGSFDEWRKQFSALAKVTKGWVVLAYDLDDNCLKNYVSDTQSHMGVWNVIALLVIDVFEHAYFLDKSTDRQSHIDTFFESIDWDYVNLAAHQYGIIDRRKHKEENHL